MDEYVCKYLINDLYSAFAVYHARSLTEAMACHNSSKPDCRNVVVKWIDPQGASWFAHDRNVTVETYVHGE